MAPKAIRHHARTLLEAANDLHASGVYQALSRLHDQVIDPDARKRRTPFLLLPTHAPLHLLPVSCAIASDPQELSALGVPEHGLHGLSEESLQDIMDAMPTHTGGPTSPAPIIWAVSTPRNNASTPVDVFVLPAVGERADAGPERRVLQAVRHSGQEEGRDPLRVVALASTLLRNRAAFHDLAKRCDNMPVPPIFVVFQASLPVDGEIEEELSRLRPDWSLLQPLALALSVCGTCTGIAMACMKGRGGATPDYADDDEPHTALMQDCQRLLVLLQRETPPLDTHFLEGVRPSECGTESVLVVANSSADKALARACPDYSQWRASPEGAPGARALPCWKSPHTVVAHSPLFPSHVCVVADPTATAIRGALYKAYVIERRDVALFAPSETDAVEWLQATLTPRPGTPEYTASLVANDGDTHDGAAAYMEAIIRFILTNTPNGLTTTEHPPALARGKGRWLRSQLAMVPARLRRALGAGRHTERATADRTPLAYTTMDVSNAVLNRKNPRFFLCTDRHASASITDLWLSRLVPEGTDTTSRHFAAVRRSLYRDSVVQNVLAVMSCAVALAHECETNTDTDPDSGEGE